MGSMVEVYRMVYLTTVIVGVVLFFTAFILFFKLKICSVVRELRNSKQESDIKKLLQNTVLLNPQIQEDVPNIEGYNDLLAYYFRVLKEEEKKQQRKKSEEKKDRILKIPMYNDVLVGSFRKSKKKGKYNVEAYGSSTLVKS